MTNYKPFSFLMGISMGKWPDFEYHVGKPLATLVDHWRPLATMPENGHFGHFDHFQAWSPRVAKGRQGSPRFKGDPRVG